MNILNLFKSQKKESSLDLISKAFDFLLKNLGFELIKTELSRSYKGEYLLIYRNKRSNIQIEISADETWFHCEIRRIIDGEPAKYSDKENCIGFEDLAKLESNNNYDHFDYVVKEKGLEVILENTAKLLKRHQDILTTEKWIDTKRIEQLIDEEFQAKFGFKPSDNKNKPTFFGLVKSHALKLLNNGYQLTLNSSELPPYNRESTTEKIILENGEVTLKISQRDWRDDYSNYYLEINRQEMFEIDLNNYSDIETAAQIFNTKVDRFASEL
jgi:hypothetical protein